MSDIGIYSKEAEEAVIGCVVTDNKSYSRVKLTPSDFYFIKHEIVYQAIQELMQASKPVNYITLQAQLGEKKIAEIGGRAELMRLGWPDVSSLHADVYAQLVYSLSVRRQALAQADKIKEIAGDEAIDTAQALQGILSEVLDIARKADSASTLRPWMDIQSQVYDTITERVAEYQKNPNRVLGISTGYAQLDKYLYGVGWMGGDVNIIAGYTGMGKTAFLLSMLVRIARSGKRVLFFSGEMSVTQLNMRIYSIVTEIPVHRIMQGKMTEAEYKRWHEAVSEVSNWQITLNDDSRYSTGQLRTDLSARPHQFDVIILDGIMEMDPAKSHKEKRLELDNIMRDLEAIAQDYNLPIIASHQMSRESAKGDKPPAKHHMADSASVERKASRIFGLFRPDVIDPATEFPNVMEIHILKNRHGGEGMVRLYYDREYTAVKDATASRVDLSHLE